jgi:hypothetical protein
MNEFQGAFCEMDINQKTKPLHEIFNTKISVIKLPKNHRLTENQLNSTI